MASIGNARGFFRVIVDVLAAYGLPPARGRRRVGGLWYTNGFGKCTEMISEVRRDGLTRWSDRIVEDECDGDGSSASQGGCLAVSWR